MEVTFSETAKHYLCKYIHTYANARWTTTWNQIDTELFTHHVTLIPHCGVLHHFHNNFCTFLLTMTRDSRNNTNVTKIFIAFSMKNKSWIFPFLGLLQTISPPPNFAILTNHKLQRILGSYERVYNWESLLCLKKKA